MAEHVDGVLGAGAGAGAGVPGRGRGAAHELPAEPSPAEASDEAHVFRLGLDLVAGRLTARGRLDRGTAHLLHDAIAAMLATERKHWRVGVTELVVGDRFGLQVLTAAYRRMLRRGRRMTLEGASPELRQALTRLRLDHHLLPPRREVPEGPTAPAEPTPKG